jgi:hypothetical protein
MDDWIGLDAKILRPYNFFCPYIFLFYILSFHFVQPDQLVDDGIDGEAAD